MLYHSLDFMFQENTLLVLLKHKQSLLVTVSPNTAFDLSSIRGLGSYFSIKIRLSPIITNSIHTVDYNYFRYLETLDTSGVPQYLQYSILACSGFEINTQWTRNFLYKTVNFVPNLTGFSWLKFCQHRLQSSVKSESRFRRRGILKNHLQSAVMTNPTPVNGELQLLLALKYIDTLVTTAISSRIFL